MIECGRADGLRGDRRSPAATAARSPARRAGARPRPGHGDGHEPAEHLAPPRRAPPGGARHLAHLRTAPRLRAARGGLHGGRALAHAVRRVAAAPPPGAPLTAIVIETQSILTPSGSSTWISASGWKPNAR